MRSFKLRLLLHKPLVGLQRDGLTRARETLEQRRVLGLEFFELLRAHCLHLCGRVCRQFEAPLALRVELARGDALHKLGHLTIQRRVGRV